jgi:hypothetical protein
MAKKYLVEVQVPAAQKCFDVRIPADSYVGELTPLIASLAAHLSEGSFRPSECAVLCNAETGELYDINMTAAAQGICNGSRLILI